ncbi:MAG: 50S ribosomal protein L19 [Planctomycetota bacterium]
MDLMRQIEIENMKTAVPDFSVGDSVNVHYLIREGDKERVQIFAGTVIAIRGSGIRRTVVVRRIVAGEGVERIFPIHSPRVQNIEVKARGRVRRAKLYYLRERMGKAVRLAANFGKVRGTRSLRRRPEGDAKA